MSVRVQFKGVPESGVYDTLYTVDALGAVMERQKFIRLEWRRPPRREKGEAGYTRVPILIAVDSIESVTEAADAQ
jgi:hypothetical protein